MKFFTPDKKTKKKKRKEKERNGVYQDKREI